MNKNIILNPSVLTYNGKVQNDFKIRLNINLGELEDVSTADVMNDYAIIYDEPTRSWKAKEVPKGGLPKDIIYYGDNISLLTNDVGYIASGDNISLLTNDVGYINAKEVPVDGITVIYNTSGEIEAVSGGIGEYLEYYWLQDGEVLDIPIGRQHVTFGGLTVDGIINLDGKMEIR